MWQLLEKEAIATDAVEQRVPDSQGQSRREGRQGVHAEGGETEPMVKVPSREEEKHYCLRTLWEATTANVPTATA